MTKPLLTLNPKQTVAIDHLEDKETNFVLYGGAAGGGKSWLGSYWLHSESINYPGTVSLMGRSKLKTLKTTTLQTYFKVLKFFGHGPDICRYNDQKSWIDYYNGSRIYLKDLFLYPSDPEFDDLGSLELTRGFIDEANQITVKARNIVFSRIREKLDENGLIQKLLMTCNPAKNWTYADYYKPSVDGALPVDRKFVRALVSDNPDISKQYAAGLRKLSENERQRLLFGNWDYDDDPARLMEFNKIMDLFTNDFVEGPGERFITADIALHGSDKFTVLVWDDLTVINIEDYDKSEADEVENKIKDTAKKYNVPRSNIIYDADGLGSYLRSYLRGAQPFVNGSRPLEVDGVVPNFSNLKAQCCYKLAELVTAAEIYIKHCTPSQREALIEELSWIKSYKADKDGKLFVLPKEHIKEQIGRSPDFSDSLMMRMWFVIKRSKVTDIITESTKDKLTNMGKYHDGDFIADTGSY